MSRVTQWRLSRVRDLGIAFLILTALWTTGAGVVASGIARWPRQPPDEWTRLIDTGDRLAASGGAEASRWGTLSARAAYLLAFHDAQDATDASRMLVAADRLERLGERRLAAHARHVAAWVALSELGSQGNASDDGR